MRFLSESHNRRDELDKADAINRVPTSGMVQTVTKVLDMFVYKTLLRLSTTSDQLACNVDALNMTGPFVDL